MNPFEPLRRALDRTKDSYVTLTGAELLAACDVLPATHPHVVALSGIGKGAVDRAVMLPRGHVEQLLALIQPAAIGEPTPPLTA